MGFFRRMFRRPDYYKMRKEKDVEGLIEIFKTPNVPLMRTLKFEALLFTLCMTV